MLMIAKESTSHTRQSAPSSAYNNRNKRSWLFGWRTSLRA